MNRSTYVLVPLLALAAVLVSLIISSGMSPSAQLARDIATQKNIDLLHWCEHHASPACQGVKATTS